MSCAIRIFNHAPRVNIAGMVGFFELGGQMQIAVRWNPPVALVCFRGTVHPMPSSDYMLLHVFLIEREFLRLEAQNENSPGANLLSKKRSAVYQERMF